MRLVEITLNTPPVTGQNYTYKLKVTKYNGNVAYIHYGKFYASAGQGTVTLDLADVLWNYRYKGEQTFTPVVSVANNNYEMPTLPTATILSDLWYNKVQVVDTENTPRFSSPQYTFFFLPEQMAGYGGITLPLNYAYVPVLEDTIIPHIPNNPPAGFKWSVMFYPTGNVNVKVWKDATQLWNVTTNNAVPYAMPLSGATGGYTLSVNGDKQQTIAVVDQCNKPYYLVWQANNGALQCQGFTDTSKLKVKYDTKNRVDIHNFEWKVSATNTTTWSLKSQNLSNDELKAYYEMFNSPYLVLLDMKVNRMYYVNVASTSYEEKKTTRVDRKPKFFEVDVSACEHLRL